MSRLKIRTEKIKFPEQLIIFEGWEIRRIYTYKPGILLQNPNSGEKIRITLSRECFSGGGIGLQKCEKKQPLRIALTSKKGGKINEKK